MANKEHIESGILELYIAGALSKKENEQVYNLIQKHPEILEEVKEIEKTISTLTSSVAPKETENSFKDILIKMIQEKEDSSKVVAITKPNNWAKYSGWAAAILIGSTLAYSVYNTSTLNNKLEAISTEKQQFELQLEKAATDLAHSIHGAVVTKSIAPSVDIPCLVSLSNAFLSACITSGLVLHVS